MSSSILGRYVPVNAADLASKHSAHASGDGMKKHTTVMDEEEDDDDEKLDGEDAQTMDVPTIDELMSQFNELRFDTKVHKTPPIFKKSHEGVSSEQLIIAFNTAYNRWFGKDMQKVHPLVRPYLVYGFRLKCKLTEVAIEKVYSLLHLEVVNLEIAFQKLGIMDEKQSMVMSYQMKFNQLHELLYNSREALISNCRTDNGLDTKTSNATPEKFDLFRFSGFDNAEMSEYEQLLRFIQKRFVDKELMVVKDMLQKEKTTRYKGTEYYTSHREPYMPIRKFILQECNPRTNARMFTIMNDKNNLDRLVRYLIEADDPTLPPLKRDRSVSSWRNGVWFAEHAAFYPYSLGRLPHQVCSAVYIDQVFDNRDYGPHFMDIPCVVTKILEDQNFSREEQSFILGVALGRLIFEPGKFDRWEIIPFLWGLAGTGKSCILEAVCKLFDCRDVQGVGNNFEKQFGLANLIGKFLWCCNDVKKNFGMDAGDLQTITSLELMSAAVKYGDAISLKWDVLGIMAGNEFPESWKDAFNALGRRILVIDFLNQIQRDNSIKTRLDEERSLFYRIITYAYHYWQRKCGDKDVWAYAPTRFKDARDIIKQHENPIQMFIKSQQDIEITKDPKDYIKEIHFIDTFRKFQGRYGFRQRLAPADMRQIIKNEGVKVKYCTQAWPAKQTIHDEDGNPLIDPITKEAKKITTSTDTFYYGIKLVKRHTSSSSSSSSSPPPPPGGGGSDARGSGGGNFNRYSRIPVAGGGARPRYN
jgi:hypothetical protein